MIEFGSVVTNEDNLQGNIASEQTCGASVQRC